MKVTIDITRRRLIWTLGSTWALGWFGLFLEIYRWQHRQMQVFSRALEQEKIRQLIRTHVR